MTGMTTASFYSQLPVVTTFDSIFSDDVFHPVPDDWWMIVVDIEGSTALIADGRYRDVNFVGASSIAAARNAATTRDVPYVFGGDGATFLVPSEDLDQVGAALKGAAEATGSRFSMTLRVGAVHVGALRSEGFTLSLARFRASESYHQAIFEGSAVAEAEARVKGQLTATTAHGKAALTLFEDVVAVPPDFTGLECRWKRIKSRRGETVSLILEADGLETYQHFLSALNDIYGSDAERRPVHASDLRPSFGWRHLGRLESRLRARPGMQWLYTLRIWVQQFLLVLFTRGDMHVGGIEWKAYLPTLSATTDIQKYDGTLRMVLTGTPAERHRLEAWLRQRHDEGLLAWGMHVSDSAIMTCLVYERLGDQVHFVDGSGGGYAMAAIDFKARKKA